MVWLRFHLHCMLFHAFKGPWSTRLTGMARYVGMRVWKQPKFFSAELHKRAHPTSVLHKTGSRLPLPHCPLWSSSPQQPQQHSSVACPSKRETISSVLLSLLDDKGVKPKERGSHSSQERGKVSGSGGPRKAEQIYYKFFKITINNSTVS